MPGRHACVEARALIDEALDVARQTDIGFHLLDRIYGTRISLHADDPAAALHVMEDASESVRGPLETCPGCRITFAVPAAIAAARAGEIEDGEPIRVEARAGTLVRADGTVLPCAPIPGFLLDMVEAGGLLAQLQRRFQRSTE